MGNLIIKGKGGAGNKLIIQDQAGGAVLTTGDSGATIANATLVAPALGTPASGTLTNATFPPGHVVDVKTAIYTGESAYGSSADGEAITALSVTMNPADGNDILITCHIACSAASGIRGGFWVSKSGTSFLSGGVAAANGSRHRAAAAFTGDGSNGLTQCSFQNLDVDPYTGSSITYRVIADGEGNYSINVNKSHTHSDSASVYVAISSITAMEIQR